LANEEKGADKPGEQSQPATPITRESEAQATIATKNCRDQDTQKAVNNFDRDLVRWTRFVGVFTGLLFIAAVLQFCAMRGQLTVMQGQLDAMDADQRPWVSVFPKDGLSIIEPLTFDTKNGATMRIAYKLRNTGKSPGLHVRAAGKIVILPGETWQKEEMAKSQAFFCDPMRNIEDQFYDAIIFPGDEIDSNLPVSMSASEIQSGLKKKDSGPFAHPGFISPSLIMCFDYQLVSNHIKHFQTRYAFILGIPIQNGLIMGDIKPEGTRPDVRLIYFSQSAD
jgi:hypothetical protein